MKNVPVTVTRRGTMMGSSVPMKPILSKMMNFGIRVTAEGTIIVAR